jgi:hypothetical protein
VASFATDVGVRAVEIEAGAEVIEWFLGKQICGAQDEYSDRQQLTRQDPCLAKFLQQFTRVSIHFIDLTSLKDSAE